MANRLSASEWDEIQSRIRKSKGLAPLVLQTAAIPGAVYVIDNLVRRRSDGTDRGDTIRYPTDEINASNTDRDFRRVILLQAARLCRGDSPPTVLVIPCSASHRGPVSQWDYRLEDGEDGFDKPGIVAYCSLIQPILKSKLETKTGVVRAETLVVLQKKVIDFLGVPAGLASADPLNIPPPK